MSGSGGRWTAPNARSGSEQSCSVLSVSAVQPLGLQLRLLSQCSSFLHLQRRVCCRCSVVAIMPFRHSHSYSPIMPLSRLPSSFSISSSGGHSQLSSPLLPPVERLLRVECGSSAEASPFLFSSQSANSRRQSSCAGVGGCCPPAPPAAAGCGLAELMASYPTFPADLRLLSAATLVPSSSSFSALSPALRAQVRGFGLGQSREGESGSWQSVAASSSPFSQGCSRCSRLLPLVHVVVLTLVRSPARPLPAARQAAAASRPRPRPGCSHRPQGSSPRPSLRPALSQTSGAAASAAVSRTRARPAAPSDGICSRALGRGERAARR